MKIIITMAGLGSRFKEVGINIPKYKIIAKEKTLFEWALISLKDFFDQEFIFVSRNKIHDEVFLSETCKKTGILNFKFVVLNQETDGQATTALFADKHIADNDPIAIYNIDTYVKPFSIKKSQIKNKYSGFIPVIEASGGKWSFVKTDKNNFAVDVAEKKEISNLATVGFYYFDKWKTYKNTYNYMLEKIKSENKEVYIAPMYKHLIEQGKKIYVQLIDKNNVKIMGTPEELKEFNKN